jgi:hypothetical protein
MNYLIFYAKNPFSDEPVSISRLPITHRYVRSVQVDDTDDNGLDVVFYLMQGEMWSPHGEQKPLVMELGVKHTSMMLNDVIFSAQSNIFYVVQPFGFSKLEEDRERYS